eukprot:8248619-Alexandrium_andersonii.AAC.1
MCIRDRLQAAWATAGSQKKSQELPLAVEPYFCSCMGSPANCFQLDTYRSPCLATHSHFAEWRANCSSWPVRLSTLWW